eukprot:724545-Prymnesium_polylepis.1
MRLVHATIAFALHANLASLPGAAAPAGLSVAYTTFMRFQSSGEYMTYSQTFSAGDSIYDTYEVGRLKFESFTDCLHIEFVDSAARSTWLVPRKAFLEPGQKGKGGPP